MVCERAKYTQQQIDRAKLDAEIWLDDNAAADVLTWEDEARLDVRFNRDPAEKYAAPAIAGYEALELEGRVVRMGKLVARRFERVIFHRVD